MPNNQTEAGSSTSSVVEKIQITDSKVLLYRHLVSSYYKNGKISQKAFIPRPKDNGELSVFDSSKIEKKESFRVHKYLLNRPSVGMSGVSVGLLTSLTLKAYTDPVETLPIEGKTDGDMARIKVLNDSHAFIDMKDISDIDRDSYSASIANEANTKEFYNFDEFDVLEAVSELVTVSNHNEIQ